ncbi:MAG: hypothetical protein XD75_0105 [Parcubacteria bacterium 33_209]|nr:MAG: hypothetical protein XD75_0105 [Parcubacteria bacterium 33_209]
MIKNNFVNMNKKILGLIVFTLCITFLGAGLVYADSLDGCKITNVSRLPASLSCPLTDGMCLYSSGDCGMCCMLNGVYNMTDWVFVLLMAISSLMIIWGAVLFTTSSGDTEKTIKARQLITFAAVGIVVALFSRAIPAAIKMILGV